MGLLAVLSLSLSLSRAASKRGLPTEHELECGLHLSFGRVEGVKHRVEARLLRCHVRVAKRLPRLRLRQPDRANRRVGEDDRRNEGVVDTRARLPAVETVREPPARSDRHRR